MFRLTSLSSPLACYRLGEIVVCVVVLYFLIKIIARSQKSTRVNSLRSLRKMHLSHSRTINKLVKVITLDNFSGTSPRLIVNYYRFGQ